MNEDNKRLERIEEKLDSIKENLIQHAILHERNSISLEHHIKRTDLLEESLSPLKQTDTILRALVKGITIAGTLVGIVLAILKFHKGI